MTNVRFEGNNGHDADVTRCLLMTLSGHQRPPYAPGAKVLFQASNPSPVLPHEAASAEPTIIWSAAANSARPNPFFTTGVSDVPARKVFTSKA